MIDVISHLKTEVGGSMGSTDLLVGNAFVNDAPSERMRRSAR
jgi:hypothetical protein